MDQDLEDHVHTKHTRTEKVHTVPVPNRLVAHARINARLVLRPKGGILSRAPMDFFFLTLFQKTKAQVAMPNDPDSPQGHFRRIGLGIGGSS